MVNYEEEEDADVRVNELYGYEGEDDSQADGAGRGSREQCAAHLWLVWARRWRAKCQVREAFGARSICCTTEASMAKHEELNVKRMYAAMPTEMHGGWRKPIALKPQYANRDTYSTSTSQTQHVIPPVKG